VFVGKEFARAKKVIEKYYSENTKLYWRLISHSEAVMKKALRLAKGKKVGEVDLQLVKEGALLHDIGVYLTDAPQIGCFGEKPYLLHGVLGREILEREGFREHALICERHVGSGIGRKEIEEKGLPLPPRDLIPVTPEEEIICLADKFFKKSSRDLFKERTVEEIKEDCRRHGEESFARLERLLEKYV